MPMVGEKFDGHNFIDEALRKGAAGVIEEADLYDAVREKLRNYDPMVVGITGSTGKTTTKELLATVLSQKYKVLKSRGNFNTRLGLSLQVTNELEKSHEVFVAEMGMDYLTEIREICEVIRPDISLVTVINQTHLEKLGSMSKIVQAKGEIVKALGSKGVAFLNFEDLNVRKLKNLEEGRKCFYYPSKLDLQKYMGAGSVLFSNLKVNLSGVEAVAKHLGLSKKSIIAGLKKYKNPPGRLRILRGIYGSKIIDDSYNSSPTSALAALEVLKNALGKRKVAILADMLELGSYESLGHKNVVKMAGSLDLDLLIFVGDRMQREVGIVKPKNKVYCFKGFSNLKENLKKLVRPRSGDVILVKGSQGMRMEKIVYELMKEKERAKTLLVRQTAEWAG